MFSASLHQCGGVNFVSHAGAVAADQFGPGLGPIFIANVGCTGNESSLFECPANTSGIHTCTHSEDAGVQCSALIGM